MEITHLFMALSMVGLRFVADIQFLCGYYTILTHSNHQTLFSAAP